MSATVNEVWRCISDEKSLRILRAIHDSQPALIADLKMSRKQYYSRIAKLSRCNLVYKSGGGYTVTSLGKIVHGVVRRIAEALGKDYWKFVVIDCLESVDNLQMSNEELKEVIGSIITDTETRDIFISSERSC